MEGTEMLSLALPSTSEVVPTIESTPRTGSGSGSGDERSMKCPLCGLEVRFFYLNFEIEFWMCENTLCQFPYDIEELKFNRYSDKPMSDIGSTTTKPSNSSLLSPTGSQSSTNVWADIERMNRILNESEDSQIDRPVVAIHPDQSAIDRHIERERQRKQLNKERIARIKNNVEQIKGLNNEMMKMSESRGIITNEKWIKKLLTLQGMSKSSLLKPQELKQIRTETKTQPEIRINIQPGDNNTISSIQIDLA